MWTAIVVCALVWLAGVGLGPFILTCGVAAERRGIVAAGIVGWLTGILSLLAAVVLLVWKLVVWINS
jgi:hypothetical protein